MATRNDETKSIQPNKLPIILLIVALIGISIINHILYDENESSKTDVSAEPVAQPTGSIDPQQNNKIVSVRSRSMTKDMLEAFGENKQSEYVFDAKLPNGARLVVPVALYDTNMNGKLYKTVKYMLIQDGNDEIKQVHISLDDNQLTDMSIDGKDPIHLAIAFFSKFSNQAKLTDLNAVQNHYQPIANYLSDGVKKVLYNANTLSLRKQSYRISYIHLNKSRDSNLIVTTGMTDANHASDAHDFVNLHILLKYNGTHWIVNDFESRRSGDPNGLHGSY